VKNAAGKPISRQASYNNITAQQFVASLYIPHLADDGLLAQRLALRVDSPRRSDISGVGG
jgi:hypothetical protein